jgi:chemotaxis protein MotB
MTGLARGERRRFRPAGGWLITFADIMTQLVCFFVLIVSYSVIDEAKVAVVAGSLREAFGISEERRYAGDVKLKGTPEQRQPGNIRPSTRPTASAIAETLTARPAAGSDGVDGAFDRAAAEKKRYAETGRALLAAVRQDPFLRGAEEAITINLVEDGMTVVLVDAEGAPMFELGSARPTARAEALLRDTARALTPLANRIRIEGHADATGSGGYSPFDLTAERANAARRVMEAAGLPSSRIAAVSGRGAADPLYPEDPYRPGNRRIEILLEPAAPLLPEKRSL